MSKVSNYVRKEYNKKEHDNSNTELREGEACGLEKKICFSYSTNSLLNTGQSSTQSQKDQGEEEKSVFPTSKTSIYERFEQEQDNCNFIKTLIKLRQKNNYQNADKAMRNSYDTENYKRIKNQKKSTFRKEASPIETNKVLYFNYPIAKSFSTKKESPAKIKKRTSTPVNFCSPLKNAGLLLDSQKLVKTRPFQEAKDCVCPIKVTTCLKHNPLEKPLMASGCSTCQSKREKNKQKMHKMYNSFNSKKENKFFYQTKERVLNFKKQKPLYKVNHQRQNSVPVKVPVTVIDLFGEEEDE